jgi:putative endonuclease
MSMAAIWTVYLVRCRDGSLYTGITTDVARRLAAHNAGTASRYTRSRLPVTLVHEETGFAQGTALRREAAIKRLPRRLKLELSAKRPPSRPTMPATTPITKPSSKQRRGPKPRTPS